MRDIALSPGGLSCMPISKDFELIMNGGPVVGTILTKNLSYATLVWYLNISWANIFEPQYT